MIVGVQCDICGIRNDADKSDHTPRIDIDDGDAIIRADLCAGCLAQVRQVLRDHLPRMRPVTEWVRGCWRSWSYDQIDEATGSICRASSICDEGLWSRFS